jgi:hypothetical protein
MISRMVDRNDVTLSIAHIARGQHGLVTVEQLDRLGLTRHAQCRRVAAGSLVRVGGRVLAVGGAPATWDRSALAACLDHPAGVLSHLSAARVWRLEVPPDDRIHVTVAFGQSVTPRWPGVVVHRTRSLSPSERTRCGAMAVTTLPRTIVDLGAVLPPRTLGDVVDDVLSRRLVPPDRLRTAAATLAGARRAGSGTLLKLLEPWVGRGRPESVPEVRLRRAISRAGLPEPVGQLVIRLPDGFTCRADLAWPDHMLVVEMDGFRWHANPRSYGRDSERTNRLVAAGWTVLRTTPYELETMPEVLMEALARHLGRERV